MLDTPALLVGMTGAALLAGSVASTAIEARSTPSAFMAGNPGPHATMSVFEAHENGNVIVSKGQNDMFFGAVPMMGATRFVKNPDSAVVIVRRQPIAPIAQEPAQEHTSEEQAPPKRTRIRVIGCEGAVSPLVKSQASIVPGLCLT